VPILGTLSKKLASQSMPFLLLCASFENGLLILPQMCAIGRYKIMYFLILCFQSFVQFSPEVSATVNPVA